MIQQRSEVLFMYYCFFHQPQKDFGKKQRSRVLPTWPDRSTAKPTVQQQSVGQSCWKCQEYLWNSIAQISQDWNQSQVSWCSWAWTRLCVLFFSNTHDWNVSAATCLKLSHSFVYTRTQQTVDWTKYKDTKKKIVRRVSPKACLGSAWQLD